MQHAQKPHAPPTQQPVQSPRNLQDALSVLLEAGKLELVPLPHIAQQVLSTAGSDATSGTELADVVRRDQSLAASVLRMANSAALGGRVKIVSLEQAVTRLGMQRILETAVAVSLRAQTLGVTRFEAELQLFWRHAFASGLYAKEIAQVLRENPETNFLCGLLHQIGKPLALRAIAKLLSTGKLRASDQEIADAVAKFHTRCGVVAAERWDLPRTMQEVIACWHDFEKATTFQQTAMITCLASQCAGLALQLDAQSEATLREHPVCRALNLTEENLARFLGARERILEIVAAATP